MMARRSVQGLPTSAGGKRDANGPRASGRVSSGSRASKCCYILHLRLFSRSEPECRLSVQILGRQDLKKDLNSAAISFHLFWVIAPKLIDVVRESVTPGSSRSVGGKRVFMGTTS
ncbi:uncharacterized protein BO95DRAFT_66855 [Aspergillus brunneoviolaceus CBS 621.78]|uniref:Uncharacterized protein n=2 Tax=Aspergillus TaxID=5052 RepID=A0A8G1RPK3_9EURO|nr:hypothetical protein BO95DRAFT_66855 [Aspergillus brunneoviolaceus CBS 621.78]XP_040800282.1 uncharacterized protein BO72DRAFT_145006 [Aspergillus fijiensis CBS 313.89]RAH48062.1 hypothetical protein BO95DRAFT_66855 [Aspergillus brunneoviolaceus CBS 621.78]RAK76272.1 hypothetical protein BO72DRAFT_145006 [Aspergillus fijiensis CBS 313.89]